jgi:hypothetical protein
MENRGIDQNTVEHVGSMISLSFILFAVTFLLVFNSIEYDLGLFIGLIGIIIFLTQGKYIKSEIKKYVYAGIILFILSIIASSIYLVISLSLVMSSIASHEHGNEIAGKYFIGYFINYYFGSSLILIIAALISYILVSYKFLLGHKLPFIAGLVISTILNIIYTLFYILRLKNTIGNEMINISEIGYYESQIKYAGDAGGALLIRLMSVLIFTVLFIYLGIYVRKHANKYIDE